MTIPHRIVPLALGDRSYSIHIGPGARRTLRDTIRDLGAERVAVIADAHVADLHLATLRQEFAAAPAVLTFPRGEASKSLAEVERLTGELARARLERGDVIVAFGGGVAGDLAGFVAATWLRGVRFIQVPTTIEAAVDASVGGKTAVNIPAGKNLVGAFHQPSAVIVDTDFLATLDERDFVAGLAESVKHALIRDAAFLPWHEQHAAALRTRDPGVVTELIARNCAIKADVVSRDEREAGLRAILNYGHTLGHAFEALLDYELRHGECVGPGMIAENALAVRRGLLDAGLAARVERLLGGLGLPTRLPRALDAAAVLDVCRVDKKNRGGRVSFVLVSAPGETVRIDDATDEEIVTAAGAVQG